MQSIMFQSLGGLGIFLFGMKIMSEGLQKVAGRKMRQVLGMVSNNRFIGCAVGTLVTSVIQSSSATTVMLVSFVDAGLMTLTQAIGVILGANIGTTVTAQLIAFNITAYALPAIAAGVLLKFFLGRRKWVYVGDVLLGFGLVFFGLATMKAGFSPLRENETFIQLFTRFNTDNMGGILLCVFVGTLLTMVLQSSSATVGITMAMAMQGLLTFEASVALILGDNIGTTITAQLASLGANVNARRTANAHTLFNVFGVVVIISVFPLFLNIVTWLTSSFVEIGAADLVVNGEKPHIARYIANSHTLFNVVNAVLFLILLPYLVKVATLVTPSSKEEEDIGEFHHLKFIDSKFIETPDVAISQAKAEAVRMGEAVQLMYDDVIQSVRDRNIKELSKWKKREDIIDNIQKEITRFLTNVIQKQISSEESREVSSLLRMANNLERLGDAIENIAELGEELMDQNVKLSEGGMHDYDVISKKVKEFLDLVIEGMLEDDVEIIKQAGKLEEEVNQMREDMRGNYLMRLQSGMCTVDPGLILVDMLTAFEKMGDYCFNIAEAVAGVK